MVIQLELQPSPPGSPGQSTARRLVVWDFVPLYYLSLWLGSPWGRYIIWTKQLFSAGAVGKEEISGRQPGCWAGGHGMLGYIRGT